MQYCFNSSKPGYPKEYSSTEFDENIIGSTLELKLKNLPSSITGQGTSIDFMDRNSCGRPKVIVEKHLHVVPI